MADSGRKPLGSSSVPTRTVTRCGRADTSRNTVEPQSGQKHRVIVLLLSPVFVYRFGSPLVRRKPVAGKPHPAAWPLPLWRWQSRQQQNRANKGLKPHNARRRTGNHRSCWSLAPPFRLGWQFTTRIRDRSDTSTVVCRTRRGSRRSLGP